MGEEEEGDGGVLTNSSPMPRDAPCTMDTPPAPPPDVAVDENALAAAASVLAVAIAAPLASIRFSARRLLPPGARGRLGGEARRCARGGSNGGESLLWGYRGGELRG